VPDNGRPSDLVIATQPALFVSLPAAYRLTRLIAAGVKKGMDWLRLGSSTVSKRPACLNVFSILLYDLTISINICFYLIKNSPPKNQMQPM
jgi:hypothetical protein